MEGDNTALSVANLLSLEQDIHLDFLRQRLRQNSTFMMSFCLQLVNIGCGLLRGAFRELSHAKKGESEKGGEIYSVHRITLDMKTTKETVCTLQWGSE